jgi:hypothetical protein
LPPALTHKRPAVTLSAKFLLLLVYSLLMQA